MDIHTLYDMSQQVEIKEVGLIGTIVGVRMEGLNLIYKLEYWMNGEVKVVDQDEWQLRLYTPKGGRDGL